MINVFITTDPRYNVSKDFIKTTIIDALQKHHITGKVEVSVSIVGDRKMHELNRRYRNIDSTTNILTFALEDPATRTLHQSPNAGFVAAPDSWLRLGDIVLSFPQIIEDAAEQKTTIEEELSFLIEHGLKHLLGLHHE